MKINKILSQNRKNIAKISFGTLMGQAISVIMLPILARIYGPTILGVFALFQSLAAVISSFSDLGMSHALMVVQENEKEELYKVISTLTAILGIISSILITLYYLTFSNITMDITFFLIYLIILTFTTKQIQVCYMYLNREGKYNVLMKNPIINNISYALIAVLLSFTVLKSYGYYLGFLFGQLITIFHMKRHLPISTFTLNYKSIMNTIKIQNNFVKFQTPANFLSNIKNQLPVFLINTLWGSKMLGYYSLTVRLLQIPSTLLANAIGRVFFNTISTMKRNGKNIGDFVLNNLIKGMKMATIPLAFLVAFSDVIVILFFGSDWEVAGNFIRILSIQYFFMFLTTSVQGLPSVVGRQKYAMNVNIIQIIFFIIGALIGTYVYNDIYVTLVLMSVSYVILNLIYYYKLLQAMNAPSKKYVITSIISVTLMVSFALLLRFLAENLGLIEFLTN